MATLTKNNRGAHVVQYRDTAGKRRTLTLGRIPVKLARSISSRVDSLIEFRAAGQQPDADLLKWADELDEMLRRRLEQHKLIPARITATVSELIDRRIKAATPRVTPGTMVRLKQGLDPLRTQMGDRLVTNVTEADADAFEADLLKTLSIATVRKRVGDARSVFALAVKDGLIKTNPFASLKASVPPTRNLAFVEEVDALAVLDELPDAQWRLLFALARWGGLRCPSEPKRLVWNDIAWNRDRMTIRGKGGEDRIIPIFPEIRPHLMEVQEQAEPGVAEVLPMLANARGVGGTIRNGLVGAIRRAGVKQWPRLWHNLRATRATELADRFPLKVVTAWLGHDIAIALRHYHQVTEAHYTAALQNRTPQASAGGRDAVTQGAGAQDVTQEMAGGHNG